MTLDELLELSDAEQKDYLNGQLAEGKTLDEIVEALGTDKQMFNLCGFFLVGKQFMIKPTRGYIKTKPTNLG